MTCRGMDGPVEKELLLRVLPIMVTVVKPFVYMEIEHLGAIRIELS